MNRASMIAALAGLTLSATALSQTGAVDPLDPSKPAVPGAIPGPGLTAKPKPPLKPAIVDLTDAAKQPRKRTPRPPRTAPTPAQPTPAQPVPALAPSAPSVSPATGPGPSVLPPIAAPQVGPEGPSATKPAPESTPADAHPVVVTPAAATEVGPHVSIVPAVAEVPPAQPAITIATVPSAPQTPEGGVAIDIESVATAPAKGVLRQSPVEIGAQEQTRSARQVVPIDAPASTPTDTPLIAERAPDAPTGVIVYDQSIPNPAAALLPPVPAQSLLSPTFVENWPSGRGAAEPVVPTAPVEQTPAVASAPETSETPAVAPPSAPIHTQTDTPVVVDSKPAAATPVVAAPVEATGIAVVTAPPVVVAPAEPAPAPEKPAVAIVEPARPLEVQPAPEPMPPVVATPVVTPIAVPVDARPTPIEPAPPVTPAPIIVEASKPSEVSVPDVAPLDASNFKLVPPPVVEAPIEARVAVTTPVHIEPAPAPTVQPAPIVVAPADPVLAPVAAPAAASPEQMASVAPEPVSLKVLSLTGTPGMVQWQLDGGSQWLIPELDELTKAKFIVRTGPDAGVEVLVDESTRVRLGRFSRAEVRSLAASPSAGQLSISLLRGVVYVVPGKGKSVSVQTPQRTVQVKEPTQITHDNGGTRMVSFTEQPNPGTTAGVPSANP